mmetsp:Transcript_27978/g.65678  ORF Transcript_27978/g.65678 Transcript_27978/m.65678 type:complete len:85 (-) Transcript_27978:173-427(-)
MSIKTRMGRETSGGRRALHPPFLDSRRGSPLDALADDDDDDDDDEHMMDDYFSDACVTVARGTDQLWPTALQKVDESATRSRME